MAAGDFIPFGIANIFPANARMLAKSIIYPTAVDESNFTSDELDKLRQAYANTQNRVANEDLASQREWINNLKSMDATDAVESRYTPNKIVSVGQELEQAIRHITPTLQYPDYPIQGNYGIGNAPISASFKDPAYAMATSVGRAKYEVDKQGNVHVKDTYDFPKGHSMEDYNKWSKAFQLAHTVGEKYSKQMPVDINLGKIKSKK